MARCAEEKDLDKINELRKQVNDIHVEGRPDLFKPGFGDEIRDYAKVMMNNDNSDIIVVEREGVICGMACVECVDKPETPYSKGRRFYHVAEIAVDSNCRRQGVAKELFDFMIEDAELDKESVIRNFRITATDDKPYVVCRFKRLKTIV